MTTKKAHCEHCSPKGQPGMAYHEATFNGDGEPVWKCNCCNKETPRRTNKRLTEESQLTDSQLAVITKIQQYRLREGYEVKQFHLCNLGHVASLVVTIGRKGDEGTMASVLCRYRGHFFIGRRGAIEAVDPSDKAKAKQHPLIYGWRS